MSQSTSQNASLSVTLAAPGKPATLPSLRDVRDQRRRMSRPLGLSMRAGVVLHRDDLRAGLGEQLGRRRADVAEALHRDARAVEVEAECGAPPRGR